MLNVKNIKQIHLSFFLAIFIFSVCSCKENKRRKELARIVNEWVGKEIKFLDEVPCYVLNRDTLPDICSELFQKEFKILMYVDSAGCSDCRLRLSDWKQLIEEADSLFPEQVGFYYISSPRTKEK